jgi:hypothetical protein
VHGLGHKEVRIFCALSAFFSTKMSSRLTGVFSGAPSSFQSGNSSFRARGSNTAPERMCADFGAFFDHADADFLTGFGGLLLQSAGGGQASGPAPTMTTSNSMYSRSTGYLLLKAQQFFLIGSVSHPSSFALTSGGANHLSL